MLSGFPIARLFGIDIIVRPSWFIIAALILWSFLGYFHQTFPHWDLLVVELIAAITTFLFFASIVVHELSHSLVGRAFGFSVQTITLFLLGAMAHLEDEATEPKKEFWVAIAGPLASVAISFLCSLVWIGLGWLAWQPETVGAVLNWIGRINLALGIFNLIPAFPLDGGRVLRAILWWWSGDNKHAYHWSAMTGRVFASIFMVVGLFLSPKIGLNGLWLAMIGWFLFTAAPLHLPERKTDQEDPPISK